MQTARTPSSSPPAFMDGKCNNELHLPHKHTRSRKMSESSKQCNSFSINPSSHIKQPASQPTSGDTISSFFSFALPHLLGSAQQATIMNRYVKRWTKPFLSARTTDHANANINGIIEGPFFPFPSEARLNDKDVECHAHNHIKPERRNDQ